jgi:hypothetical protein
VGLALSSITVSPSFAINRYEEETGARGYLFPRSRNFFVMRFTMRGERQVVGLNIGQRERSRPVLELRQTQLMQQYTAK